MTVVQMDGTGGGGPQTQFLFRRTDGDGSGCCRLLNILNIDNKGCDASVSQCGFSIGKDQHHPSFPRVGYPQFRAVQNILRPVVGGCRRRLESKRIGSGVGFGQEEGPDTVLLGQSGEPGLSQGL